MFLPFILSLIFARERDNPFYIGKTKNLKTRTRSHAYRLKVGSNLYCYNKLRKMLKEGHDWVIVTLEDYIPADQIDDRERYWISYYRAQGIKLTNLADGGEGGKGLTLCSSENFI